MSSPAHLRILMGTRNGAAFLEAQLQSLLAQSHDDWSLWVSDDGSDDDTREILARFDAANPGRLARCLEGPRRGSAANYLSLLCHPDLPPGPVALADQDDVWLPHKLARAVAALRRGGDGEAPQVYAARFLVVDRDLQGARASRMWPRGASFGNALVQNVLSGHSLAFDAAALALVRRVGPVDVPHHDWWLYQLFSGAGAEIHLDPEPVLLYRQHRANVFGSSGGAGGLAARARMLMRRDYGGWIAANLAALERARAELTPEARACLEDVRALLGQGPGQETGQGVGQDQGLKPRVGPARARALARLGLHRQSRTGSALLLLAAALGRI